jgi:hypothetical protein
LNFFKILYNIDELLLWLTLPLFKKGRGKGRGIMFYSYRYFFRLVKVLGDENG